MQSLGTGTQSASGLSAAFSIRPDSYLRKPGIGTDRQLGGGEKGIYKTAEVGPWDDPVTRRENEKEEEDINVNVDIDDLNVYIGSLSHAFSANDSLSRIGTKAQSNQLTAGGIGSYAGAAGPIGNSVSEGIEEERLLESFIREILLENSAARSMSFSPYAKLGKGPGYYQSSLNLMSPNDKRSSSLKRTNVIGQDMSSAGGGIVRDRSRRPRTGRPKSFTGGEAIELQKTEHVIDDHNEDIGKSTWELYLQGQQEREVDHVLQQKNRENKLKGKK